MDFLVFHLYKPIANAFPDSSLLIAVGLLLGLILKQSGAHITYSLDSHVFFLYLLPPIIFDAGYFMPNRALFENCDSVLLFAVILTTLKNALGNTRRADECDLCPNSLVLYQMFKSFTLIGPENLEPVDYAAGVLSFFVVACGGAFVGLIGAFLVSFITKSRKNC
ncbi:unnamed protein product [Strongylus vulgaris]|uniref:Cation/H+ exchanger transmembrane domain-containing protein n=1 Tax=Strongylus vulgaris TaxID=40348 RepID=A0A3P7JN43_STRVU|nr:unnamed protein product [Strongylus vulgaris]